MRPLVTIAFGALFAAVLFAGSLPPATGDVFRPAIGTSRRAAQHPAAGRTAETPERLLPSAPFPGDPGPALQVVSVVADGARATTARVTLWQRDDVAAPWFRVGPTATAWIGAGGLTSRPREGRAATPLGSFGLTQAFGRDPDTGRSITALAYRRLRPGDGWSTATGRYNRLGHSGEMYAGRNGWMRLAVLIDYNTARPVPGAGSGFFLHVGGRAPTDGCIGLPLTFLRTMLGWLDPHYRPRVVIALARN